MPYSTQADIEKAIGEDKLLQLSDDDRDGLADSEVVAQAIAWADSEIDSYAAGRYEIPFKKNGADSIPAKIADRSAELAGFWLYRRKQVVDETIQAMRDSAVAWLKELQSGKVNLDADLAGANVGVGGGLPKTSAKDTVVTDEKLKGF